MNDMNDPKWHGGGCNALALAIHDKTGWLLYEIYDDGPHTVIKTPDGQMLDHRGIRPWPSGWRHLEPSDRSEIEEQADKWGPPDQYPEASKLADALLKQAQI